MRVTSTVSAGRQIKTACRFCFSKEANSTGVPTGSAMRRSPAALIGVHLGTLARLLLKRLVFSCLPASPTTFFLPRRTFGGAQQNIQRFFKITLLQRAFTRNRSMSSRRRDNQERNSPRRLQQAGGGETTSKTPCTGRCAILAPPAALSHRR